ncbi:MAG TPA: SCO family protein [Longimicrobium sp.]|nr:SCO family protein [Longimicrobium sp.]
MTTRSRPPLVPMVLAIVAVLAGTGAYAAWLAIPRAPAFHGTTYDVVEPPPEFRLVDTQGRPATLASYRGRPVLVFFGYTSCPDVCPLTLDRLARAVRELGDDAGGARILFVTVDPKRDTPDVLRRYASRFGPGVTALTGDSAALAAAWQGYSVYVMPRDGKSAPASPSWARAAPASPSFGHDTHASHNVSAASAGPLAHSAGIYGIDRAGNLRVVITEGATEESMRDDVRTLARL